MPEEVDAVIELRTDEVPICFGVLARFGNLVIGSECLPEKFARFGCVANCEDCRVADYINDGGGVFFSVADMAAAKLAKAVKTIESVGRDTIGWGLSQDS